MKPANILLTASGEPKIADFGLARLAGGGDLTRSGLLLGTPAYMAPEQAAGDRARVGPAADVYALGAVFYELVSGRPPFRADNTLELLRAVAADEPPRPRRLKPGLPRDLEAVALYCLEKEPARRYPTALALADDLHQFLEGKSVAAHPVGSAARLARAARRKPHVALLLALLALSLSGGLLGVAGNWRKANGQRDRANANALEADAEKRLALHQAYRARVSGAGAALQIHDVADAARQLDAAPEALRGWEWRHLHSRRDDSTAAVPLGPDAGFLVAAPDRLWVGTWTDAGLRLADLDGGEVTVPVSTSRRVRGRVAHTRRGLRVAAYDEGTDIDDFDDAGRLVRRTPGSASKDVTALAFSPDGTRLARARFAAAARIDVFDLTTGALAATCDDNVGTVWALAFSPDGLQLASGGEDRALRLWDAATGAPLAAGRGHASKVVDVAYSPDGSRLVTASSDGTARQWDARTAAEAEPPYDRHSGEVFTAAYSPDGRSVATAGGDRTVRVWRSSGRRDESVSADGARLAVAGYDPVLRVERLSVLDAATGAPSPRWCAPVMQNHSA